MSNESRDAMLARDPVVELYMLDIDRTLVRQSMRMTHEERLSALQDWMNATEEVRGIVGRGTVEP